MKIENTKFWQGLNETQRAFWLRHKCETCFYFRMRFKNNETHCNNIARQKELDFYGLYMPVNRNDDACKRYRNDIVERERRHKKENRFKRKK